MNIQEITTFLAICKYGSFNKAAEHLFMTQPTVSWYVTTLEKELGHQLFIRKRGQKESVLTDAGRLFYPQAVKWESLWNETAQLLDTKVYTRYNFACVPSLARTLLPFLHTWFENHKPDWSVSLTSSISPNIISGIENGTLDIGLSCQKSDSKRSYTYEFANEDCFFVCSKNSNYPSQVHMPDLQTSNFIRINWSKALEEWNHQFFLGKPYAELHAFDDLGSFFEKPDIWSIFPYTTYCTYRGQLAIHQLDQKIPPRPFYLICTASHKNSEFNQLLSEALHEFFSTYGEAIHFG